MARTNLRRLRPKEVALVAELLSEEHDDVEELARAIVRAINRYRMEEPTFVRVVRKDGDTGAVFYGPYQSFKDAFEDTMSCGAGKPDTTYQMFVASLVPPFGQPLSDVDPASQIEFE